MSKACPLIAVVDDEQSVCVALQRLVRSADMEVAPSRQSVAFALLDVIPQVTS